MDRLMVSVSGVRGTVGGTLTPEVACRFGCAFATLLGGAGRTVTLARDSRESGPMIRNAVAAGLMASGVDVVDLGLVTTPGAALMTARIGADGGVIITASHNPRQYNGIKFLQPTGTSLTADAAEKLRCLWADEAFSLVGSERQGRVIVNDETHDAHVDAVCRDLDVDAVAKRRFRVVLDSVNGAGCAVTPLLMERLGVDLLHLNAEPTGAFAHPPEPVAENVTELGESVRAHGAAVGFAQDADADRLAVLDESGTFIGEEYTLALTAAHVLARRKGKVATNMVTSRMIDDVAAATGAEVVRAPTGEANVVQAMLEAGCVFGGEGGGGVIDPQVVLVRDSLVGIARVLEYLAVTGEPLSALVDRIPRYVMLKSKLPCPAGAIGDVIAAVRDRFAGRDDATFNTDDGLRVDLPEGWVSVRASNTEPIMRVTSEAPDKTAATSLAETVREAARGVVGDGE